MAATPVFATEVSKFVAGSYTQAIVGKRERLLLKMVDTHLASASDTFAGKTIATSTILSNTEFGDATDSTKQVAFSISGATTAKTTTLTFAHSADRAVTFPDAAGTVSLIANAEVLENKSLEATCALVDTTDNTIKLLWDLSGATADKDMTILSSHTDDRTLTLPDVTSNVVASSAMALGNDAWSHAAAGVDKVVKVAIVKYNNGTDGNITAGNEFSSGVSLPDNAIVTRVTEYMAADTASSGGTVQLLVGTGGTAITAANTADGTPETVISSTGLGTMTTAATELFVAVASEDLDDGDLMYFVEYVVAI